MDSQPKKETRNILWYTLALMAFSTVWSFGNIVNGFSEYGGLKAIVSWLLIFGFYFIPYSLMVGEMGSAFKDAGGGVSSWVNETTTAKLAYYAGWTYWIVHMPYISQKPSRIIIALSWIINGDPSISEANVKLVQIASLAIFFVVLYLSSRGVNFVKAISSVAGMSSFVMSLLFILLAIAAPALGDSTQLYDASITAEHLIPKFDSSFFLNLSILVFAVGGCEKISPYVNNMKNPSKDFPIGMIALVVMVATTAVLGTIALARFYDTNNVPADLMTNGDYYAFASLGNYYGVGKLFMIIYAISEFLGQVSVMVLSIDAPLRILIESTDGKYIPSALRKQNKYGAYTNGHKLIAVIISILIILPAFGISNMDELVRWLVRLNSVVMPLRYLWVFFAYFMLKRSAKDAQAEYRFTKKKWAGYLAAGWCFAFTLFACVMGMVSDDPFKLAMNILTPLFLIGLGLVMPQFAKRENQNAK
ncbi:amino acid permease [Allofustis seminis]|uniref:amino acid permease n=1 Tax=Allofustis seminis TaxID=166939 RepID=UPI0003681888|nr:amino acid permease [Allofustis seminis]